MKIRNYFCFYLLTVCSVCVLHSKENYELAKAVNRQNFAEFVKQFKNTQATVYDTLNGKPIFEIALIQYSRVLDKSKEDVENLLKIINFLLDQGFDINSYHSGETNLHAATYIYGRDYDMVAFLLDKGADINAPTKGSLQTPLHYAVHFNQPEITRFLLERGADTTIRDRKGLTAYELAVEKDNQKVKEVFAQHKMRPGFSKARISKKDQNVCFSHK